MITTHQELTNFIADIEKQFENRSNDSTECLMELAKCLGRCIGKLKIIRDELEIKEALDKRYAESN
jgi:hypothetical protein